MRNLKLFPRALVLLPKTAFLLEGVSSSASRRLKTTVLTTSIAALAFAAHTQAADAIFSSAAVDPANPDAIVGLNVNKTYDAVLNPGGVAVTINGVTFNPNDGSDPDLVLTGAGTGYINFASGVGGQMGTLLSDFNFGGHPGVLTLNNLIVGQTYVLTAYNSQFGSAGGRFNTVTSATSGVSSGLFDENLSPLNLLRYTFTASQASEVVNFTPLASNDSYHFYGLSSEQVFDNNRSVGGNWTAANWSKAVPTASGSNANFAAPTGAATINLDANETVGHLQFAGTGANSWTLSSTNSSALTIQSDVAGVAVLSTPAVGATHTISTAVTLGSDVIKTGAGRLVFSGAIADNGKAINLGNGTLEIASSAAQTLSGPVSGSGALVKSGAGTLTLSGALSNTGATTISAGTLEVTSASTLASAIGGAGGLLKSGASTLTLTGNSTYTGSTVVAGGVLKLQGLTAVAKTVGTAAYTNTGSYTFVPASNNLLTSGGTLIANTNAAAGSELTGGTAGALTDSSIPAFAIKSAYTVGNNASITYNLGSSVMGYDLSTINIFSQWQDQGRAKITLNDISYSTAANPSVFTAIPGSNDDFGAGGGTNLASLNATGGLLASGVSAVRFNFGNQLNGYDGYSELEVVGSASIATGTNILPAGSALQIASGATLDLNGVTQTVASLGNSGAGGGSVINSAAGTPVTLTLNPASGSTTFGGTISDTSSANAISVIKSGNGTQVLAGVNTYRGATTVNGGTLTVSGSISGASITVAQGTLLLSSNNAVNSATTGVTLGATGTSGTLQLANTLANASESFGPLSLKFNSTVDFGTGTGGEDLLFAGVGTHTAGSTLSILNWSGTATTLGTTATDRLLFTGNASDFTTAFAQNDVFFTGFGTGYRAITTAGGYEIVAVPEPSSAALLGVVGLLGFANRRRRSRQA